MAPSTSTSCSFEVFFLPRGTLRRGCPMDPTAVRLLKSGSDASVGGERKEADCV